MTTYEKYLQLQHLSYDTRYQAIMLVYCGPYILGLSEIYKSDDCEQMPRCREGVQIDLSDLTVDANDNTKTFHLTSSEVSNL